MSTRRYPHMEKGYINTRRRYDWEPNMEQQEDDPHAHATQEHNKEKEKALDLIEAYPEEMLHLMEQVDRGKITEEELSAEMDNWTEKLETQIKQHQTRTAYSCTATVDRMLDKVVDNQESNHGGTEEQTVGDTDEDTDNHGEEQQDSGSQSDSSWSEEEKTEFAQAMRSKNSTTETGPNETATQEEEEENNNNTILPASDDPVTPTTNTRGGNPRYLAGDLDEETYDAMIGMFEESTHGSNPGIDNDCDGHNDGHDEGEYGKMPSPEQGVDVRVAAAAHAPYHRAEHGRRDCQRHI